MSSESFHFSCLCLRLTNCISYFMLSFCSSNTDPKIRLIDFLEEANNAPAGTDWTKWKTRYRKNSSLFGEIIELFRASASGKPRAPKLIHSLLDQKDRKYCWTPLHWASSPRREDKTKVLMDNGADPFILSNQLVFDGTDIEPSHHQARLTLFLDHQVQFCWFPRDRFLPSQRADHLSKTYSVPRGSHLSLQQSWQGQVEL